MAVIMELASSAQPAVRAKSCRKEAAAAFSTLATNIPNAKPLFGVSQPVKNALIAKVCLLKTLKKAKPNAPIKNADI